MRALSVRQPWADLIVRGRKKIETRSWPTSYRGPLLIHASGRTPGPDGEPVRCIVGRVNLIDVVSVHDLPRLSDFERSVGDFGPGRFGWILRDPVQYTRPIPARGHLGLWEFTRR